MKKIVINHLDKIFVTADAATIVGELEVEHPAARLIVHAAKAAHAEVGDGTNAVVAIAGELLVQAEGLLREGLHTAEVADGYARALAIALASIEALTIPGSADLDVRDAAAVTARLAGPVGAKHAAGVAWLAGLVARACIAVCPVNQTNFNVDNVRVVKVSGGAPDASALVSGLALKRGVEGCVTQAADAKVAVYAQGFDTAGPETKGTVLIRSAAELEAYSGQEEAAVEALVAGVAAAGVNVVVAGGAFGDVALHYLNAAGILALRVPSKFDLRRVCRSTGATALARVEAPTAADVGFAASVGERDVGGTRVVVIEQAGGGDAATGVVSLVLRAPTDALLDELERGADAGVNAYKALTRDARALPAGGAVEAALAARLRADAATAPDLDGVALAAFAAALDVVPRTLAENSGLDATAALAALAAAHAAAPPPAAAGDVADPAAVCRLGLDLAGGPPRDLAAAGGVTDLFSARWWALKLAADAAGTVLRVDQIIMAKPAGGPRAPGGGGDWDED
jgi:T-complex protein 1 subunit theta